MILGHGTALIPHQIFLSQGVCVGIGAGLLLTPSLAILAMYFEQRRAFVVGLAICGSSVGVCHFTDLACDWTLKMFSCKVELCSLSYFASCSLR